MSIYRLSGSCAGMLAGTEKVLSRAGTKINTGEGIGVRYDASSTTLEPDTKDGLATPTLVG